MNETYRKSLLPGGVRLVTEKIPTLRSVALGVWVNVGGRNETLKSQGISHFLEHMIFKGTKRRSALDIALEIESVGGHLNAFTGKEHTCFYAHLLDENVDIAVKVLADILANSLFREEDIAREKTVIIEEINNLEDSPEDIIYDYFVQELFPGHPLGLPILGTKDTVVSFSSADLRSLIREHYTSDRVVIAAAGNLDHDKLQLLVENSFQFHQPGNYQSESPLPGFQPASKIWKKPISQAHIAIGARSYAYRDHRKYPYFIMNTLLGGGMSSRLFQSIRETFGYAYSVYTFNEAFSDTGLCGVYIGTDRNRVEEVIELVQKEFERMRREHINDATLSRLKTQLKGNLMLGLESASSRMNRLGKMEIYLHDFISLDDIINEINQVTSSQVVEVAEELLQPDNLLTVILTPSEE